ncbi:transglutaminase-like cysteine peptidase [Candidatus Kaiserbacteria bacterium]|nr:transglutaminase-like cysteine peptidase [Candidatus Kaiserbacteria bacterium]
MKANSIGQALYALGLLYCVFYPGSALAAHNWIEAYLECQQRYDAGCTVDRGALTLAHETRTFIERMWTVNDQVNESMPYLGTEPDNTWSSWVPTGNCVPHALKKRRLLRELGVPAGALRFAVVHVAGKPVLEDHLLLLVYTDQHPNDPYVLDSRLILRARLSLVLSSRQFDALALIQDAHGNWMSWERSANVVSTR